MRLASIRLSGFKSFVDGTSVHLPGQLIGIVGPNGCGKSNIIDAVRWVLGESSAKSLRGGQISDVIFSGSGTRPAANHAQIELNFENTAGKLKGDFAKYNEISVSRQVNSEGVSTYHINKIRCRRKDIIDAFLGTGLGARSYSIIQQGTISRLVEAKPDELRQYLEEAAGISHYKERRRETAMRIKSTRENLERLVDIVDELEKRLRALNTQAKQAQIYKELKQQSTVLTHELLALQWRKLSSQAENLETRNQTTVNLIESRLTKLRKIETDQEQQTQHKYQLQEEYDQSQQTYYLAKESIARTQEQIRSYEQKQQDMNQEKQELEAHKRQLHGQQASDTAEDENVKHSINKLNVQLTEEGKLLRTKQKEYLNTEQDHMSLQKEWDKFQSQSYEQRQQSELDQYKIQQLELDIINTQKQLAKISDDIPDDISRLNTQYKQQQLANDKLSGKIDKQQATLKEIKAKLQTEENQQQQQQQQMHLLQSQSRIIEGTIASLTTLLERKTYNSNVEVLNELRNKYNLGRWLDCVKVKPGWEHALETIMPELVSMDISNNQEIISNHYEAIENAQATIIIVSHNNCDTPPSGCYSCADIIEGSVPSWLQSVFFADDYRQSLDVVHTLLPHQRILCKNGTIIGKDWVATNPKSDEDATLVIHQKLEHEKSNKKDISKQINEKQRLIQNIHDLVQSNKKASEEQQQQTHDSQQQLIADEGLLKHLRHRIDSLCQENEKNIVQKKELTEIQQTAEKQLKQLREVWSKRLEGIKYDDRQRQELSDRRNFLQKQRSQAHNSFSQLQNQVGELRLQLQRDTSQQEYLSRNIKRLEHDIINIDTRLSEIDTQQKQAENQPYNLNLELQKMLDQQLKLEKQMQQRQSQVAHHEKQIKETSEKHKSVVQAIDELKARIQNLQIRSTEITTRQQTITEQLQGADPKPIADRLPEAAEVSTWNKKIQSTEHKIQLLGAVNHAAIMDYQSEKERKLQLDEQRSEIEKALTTLENTISTIDKVTKDTFRETFERINANLNEFFPQLIGGGTAKLEMTSNDLLTTGISIIARPPGKRNTSISMLSGGEKAMTAIALVFAIFQLNPAPFCMLDEVDAPLDDINNLRYINTVKSMTDKVQFILITHSKITMELLDKLIGITMSEAGVSRTVSVDINKTLSRL